MMVLKYLRSYFFRSFFTTFGAVEFTVVLNGFRSSLNLKYSRGFESKSPIPSFVDFAQSDKTRSTVYSIFRAIHKRKKNYTEWERSNSHGSTGARFLK